MLIPGFLPFMQYDIDFFFYTKEGTVPINFPNSASTISNIDGEVYIPNIVQYLGCDPENSDVAFSINIHSISARMFPSTQNSTTDNNLDSSSFQWSFSILQNPASDVLFIKTIGLNADQYIKYNIIDLHGRILRSEIINENNFNVNISNFLSGLYMVVLSNSSESYTQKFIKL